MESTSIQLGYSLFVCSYIIMTMLIKKKMQTVQVKIIASKIGIKPSNMILLLILAFTVLPSLVVVVYVRKQSKKE